jgi:hypothetical protein
LSFAKPVAKRLAVVVRAGADIDLQSTPPMGFEPRQTEVLAVLWRAHVSGEARLLPDVGPREGVRRRAPVMGEELLQDNDLGRAGTISPTH